MHELLGSRPRGQHNLLTRYGRVQTRLWPEARKNGHPLARGADDQAARMFDEYVAKKKPLLNERVSKNEPMRTHEH